MTGDLDYASHLMIGGGLILWVILLVLLIRGVERGSADLEDGAAEEWEDQP